MSHSSATSGPAAFPAVVALTNIAQPPPGPFNSPTAEPSPSLSFWSALDGDKSFADEEAMLKRFSAEFEAYAARTPRFLPLLQKQASAV